MYLSNSLGHSEIYYINFQHFGQISVSKLIETKTSNVSKYRSAENGSA